MTPLLTTPRSDFAAELLLPPEQPVTFALGRKLRQIAKSAAGRRAVRAAMRRGPAAVERLVRRHAVPVEAFGRVSADPSCLARRDLSSRKSAAANVRSWAKQGLVDLGDIQQARRSDGQPLDRVVLNCLFGRFRCEYDRALDALSGLVGSTVSADDLLSFLYVGCDGDNVIIEPPELWHGITDDHWLLAEKNPDALLVVASVFEAISVDGYASPFALYEYVDEDWMFEFAIDELNQLLQQVNQDWKGLRRVLVNSPNSLPPMECDRGLLIDLIDFLHVKTHISERLSPRFNKRLRSLSNAALSAGVPDLDVPDELRGWAATVMAADAEITRALESATARRTYPSVPFESCEDSSWFFGGFCLGAFSVLDHMICNDFHSGMMQTGYAWDMAAPCPVEVLRLSSACALISQAHSLLLELPEPA